MANRQFSTCAHWHVIRQSSSLSGTIAFAQFSESAGVPLSRKARVHISTISIVRKSNGAGVQE